ncbi:hypothetical protein FJY94_03830 [Candidatus Kaiserbacteria bacterium]|nr:hypothetical protein [Candidatus Kaiserbacteria bacterium]
MLKHTLFAAVIALIIGIAAPTPGAWAKLKVMYGIENATGESIKQIYFRQSGTAPWGKGEVQSDEEDGEGAAESDEAALADGDELELEAGDDPKKCKFDVKVEFDDGKAAIKMGVNACLEEKWTVIQEDYDRRK